MTERKTRKAKPSPAKAKPAPVAPQVADTPTPPVPRTPLALPPGVDTVADLGTLLTLREAATRLGRSAKTVRRMVERGDLPGAHLADSPAGVPTWMVPYSSVIAAERALREAQPPNPVADEIAALRERVARLETDLAVSRALADERARNLETLSAMFRTALPAPRSQRPRWWRRSDGVSPN